MTRRHPRRTILVAAMLVAAIAGCSPDPTTRWAQQRQLLTVTQDSLLQLHDAGTLAGEDLLVADPAIQAARAALSSAESRLPDGPDLDVYLDAAEAAVAAAARIDTARRAPR